MNMDQPPPNRRFQFGLRTLLTYVAIVAVAVYGYSLIPLALVPNAVDVQELSQVQLGMSRYQVRRLLGKPNVIEHYDNGQEHWGYFYSADIYFTNGECVQIDSEL
jgi:outer membrane protein assembly factor BamE (lipoprotein component of BamABCDE complex)